MGEMEDENGEVTRVQTEGRIAGVIEPQMFDEQVDSEANEYWGIPTRFFTKAGGEVYLSAALADELTWVVYERLGQTLQVSALPQKVTLDGEQYGINPGFWTAHIDESVVN